MASSSSIQTRKSKKNTRKCSRKNKKYYGGNPNKEYTPPGLPLRRSYARSPAYLKDLSETPNKVDPFANARLIYNRALARIQANKNKKAQANAQVNPK